MKSFFQAPDRDAWREWLKKHHATEEEVWLAYYKKHTGRASVSYIESVEEALCFGWIDGIKKRIDDERYAHRFTPRRAGSRWSPRNIEMAEALIREKRMTRAGRAAYKRRSTYSEEVLEAIGSSEIPLSPELERALRVDKKAWGNFTELAPSCRKQYTAWLMNAKRPDTRARRVQEAIRLLRQGKKLGMK